MNRLPQFVWISVYAFVQLWINSVSIHALTEQLDEELHTRAGRHIRPSNGNILTLSDQPLQPRPVMGLGEGPNPRRDETGVVNSDQLIRLDSSISYNEGRLLYYHNGQWRRVCSSSWTDELSHIACRMLGFTHGGEVQVKLSEDSGSGRHLYHRSRDPLSTNERPVSVTCSDDVTYLMDCLVTEEQSCSDVNTVTLKCIPDDGCENGWVGSGGLCYKLFDRKMALQSADKSCQYLGAHLLRIDSQLENDFISNWLSTAGESRVWLAAHRTSTSQRTPSIIPQPKETHFTQRNSTGPLPSTHRGGLWSEYVWKWYGTSHQLKFTKWFPGFPPNETRREPMAVDDRDCASLSHSFFDKNWILRNVNYYFWQNWPCANQLSFVCRKAVTLNENECYEANGSKYRGKVYTTIRGSICKKWTDSSKLNPSTHPRAGLGDHNYCRNPDNDKRPWCWVDTELNLFGYCSLPPCNASCTWEKEFQCSADSAWLQTCIPLVKVCDGKEDCLDGSDEIACQRKDFRVSLARRPRDPDEEERGSSEGEGGRFAVEGRVEITINNITGTICDDNWDDDSAAVVCRMLGYRDGVAVSFADYGLGTGPIWMDDVKCRGSESHLLDCDYQPIGENNCGHSEDAGVRCLTALDVEEPEGGEEMECGRRPIPQLRPKIVGGQFARYGAFPWQARIMKQNVDTGEFQHSCGGTIIDQKWILSAAHCFESMGMMGLIGSLNERLFRVRVGDHHNRQIDEYEQEFSIDKIVSHPHYTSATYFSAVSYDYDIAMIRIKPTGTRPHIQFNRYVQPACLPPSSTASLHYRRGRKSRDDDDDPYRAGTQCEISGWGVTRLYAPLTLKSGVVPIMSKYQCRSYYGRTLSENMFCAGHIHGQVDTCQGDSGGPLVCKINDAYTVLGVTSWGQGCGHRHSPGVYTKVGQLSDWIRRVMKRYP